MMLVDPHNYVREYQDIVKHAMSSDLTGKRPWEIENELLDYAITLHDCSKHKHRLVYQVTRNGARQYFWQCEVCFEKLSNWISHDTLTLEEKQNATERFEINHVDLRKIARERIMPLVDEFKNQEWNEYEAYINSPEWKAKSALVLRRDNYECKANLSGCRGRATDAHHLTYEHFRNEPLFDLIAVCRPCHDKITNMDRERR